MKKVLIPAIALLVLSFTAARASHIIGGDFSYASTGSEYYHIKLTVYRDCSNPANAPFDEPAVVGVFNNSGVLLQTLYLFANADDSSSVPIINNSPCYTPAQAPNICMEQAVYDTIIFLPSIPGGYNLSYQRCCRSPVVINLQNPSQTGSTYTFHIPDQSLAPDNSSPVFDNPPMIVLCTNENITVDQSATDPDGDVIVYSLADPYSGASFGTPQPNPPSAPPYASVAWAAGYSATYPVDANPTLSINSGTGIITGKPNGIGVYTICVVAKEYRSGNYLNETRRDYRIDFISCNPGTDAQVPVNNSYPPINGIGVYMVTCGNPTVTFTNNSLNGTTWHWNFGDNTTSSQFQPTHTYFNAGTYTVTLIANPGYSCADTFTTAVVIDPPLIADFDFDNVCSDSSIVFTDQSFCGYGTIASYLWKFGDNATSSVINPTHHYAAPGTYIVNLIIQNSIGCYDTSTQTITVYPPPVAGFTWGPACLNVQTCFTNISTVQNIGGSIINQWHWTFDGANPSNLQNPCFTFNTTGNHSVTLIVTTNHGCKDTITNTVFVNPLPVVTVNPVITQICVGQQTTLTGGGATTYSWTPSNSLSSPTGTSVNAFPVTTTTYVVTGTDAATGCSNTATSTVTVNPLPVITVNPASTAICIWQSTSLTASGANTYSWLPATGLNTTNGPTVIANPTVTTTYTVSGTNSITGCVGTQTVTVTVNPLPNVSVVASVNPICVGSNTVLTASGANTYTWAPWNTLSSQTGAVVTSTPTTTTTYTVIGTNSLTGCADTSTFTVNVNGLPNVVATPDTSICVGTSATLNVTGAVSYVWTPNQWIVNPNTPNPVVTPLNQITYVVTGTDANGCVNTDQTTVSLLPLPTVDAGPDAAVCNGDTAQLNASGSGISYIWSPATWLTNINIPNPQAFPPDTTVYTVTTTDVNGCKNSDSAEVVIFHLIFNPVIIGDTSICFDDTIHVYAFGGTIYTWTPAIGISDPNSSNPFFSPSVTTTYTVAVSNPCYSGSDSITIHVNPLPTADAGPDQDVCQGSLIQLNGAGGGQYQWTPASSLSNPNIANPTSSTTVTTTYSLVVTNNFGCQDADNMTVNVFNPPAVNLGPDVTICEGSSYQLQANPGATFYQWTPALYLDNPAIPNPVATPPDTLTYAVNVYDFAGCNSTDTIKINVQHPFTIIPFPDQTICYGAYVQLFETGGQYYDWSPDYNIANPNTANPDVDPLATTTYTVAISNDCFTLYDTINVFVNPLPVVDAGQDISMHRTEVVQLNATGGLAYYWSPSDGLNFDNVPNPLASPSVTITYHVTGTDANGCVGSDSITVSVDVLNQITIPNAFTPNGDGVNDYVRIIKVLNIEKILEFKIFDRYGKMVYVSNQMDDQGWDGTVGGDPAQIGTYVYFVRAQTYDGNIIVKQGNVTLLR